MNELRLPERPPDVEAHHVEPSERREERKVDDDACNIIETGVYLTS